MTVNAWKRGREVWCPQHHELQTSGIIEHHVPRCWCGLCLYVVALTQNPPLFAWTDITPDQRRHILHNNLNPMQALFYLQLPVPVSIDPQARTA